MIVVDGLLNVKDYASLCGVTVTTIYYRHKHGRLSSIVVDGYLFIHPILSPPSKFMGDKKKNSPHKPLLPGNINPKDLVSIKIYAEKKSVRADSYYELAMAGKIRSIVIAGIAFMFKWEADQIKIKRRNSYHLFD